MTHVSYIVKKQEMIFAFIIISAILTGCLNLDIDIIKEYDGGELIIGIIGSAPEIRENQIKFEKIDFDSLKAINFNSKYDAIFITQNNLFEASKGEYAIIYKNSNIPFYFIESEKSYIPFIEEELSYENALDFNKDMYITGLLYTKGKTWGYGLYNDTKNEINIKGVYSRVFEDISEIKSNKITATKNEMLGENNDKNPSYEQSEATNEEPSLAGVYLGENKTKVIELFGYDYQEELVIDNAGYYGQNYYILTYKDNAEFRINSDSEEVVWITLFSNEMAGPNGVMVGDTAESVLEGFDAKYDKVISPHSSEPILGWFIVGNDGEVLIFDFESEDNARLNLELKDNSKLQSITLTFFVSLIKALHEISST